MSMTREPELFADRSDAGRQVARMLEKKYRDSNALVLGIPRGGVFVAYEVARLLHAELSVVVTKKLPHPRQHELAIGAVAEDGSVFLTADANELDRETVQKIHITQLNEIKSRMDRFRKGRPLPNMHNRIVIIADDGIATGSTIIPAIKLCKSRKAAKVIVAAPVSGRRYINDINILADEVVIARQPENFYSVSQVYHDFHSLSDDEVMDQLDQYEGYFRRNAGHNVYR